MLADQIERWGQDLTELEVPPAHVQLLVGCGPQFGIHRLVRLLKEYSSQAMRTEVPTVKRRQRSL